jgi:hypothetical protein
MAIYKTMGNQKSDFSIFRFDFTDFEGMDKNARRNCLDIFVHFAERQWAAAGDADAAPNYDVRSSVQLPQCRSGGDASSDGEGGEENTK